MPETTASTEFGPRKTLVILAIVAGCFAVLLPKIFYPMLSASLNPSVHHTDGSGCCDVIFESDVTAVDIMQEVCRNIIRHHQVDPRVRDVLWTNKFNKLTPPSVSLCREEVLAKCGIDLSSFLAEKERLKKSYKQVLEEIRGFNGSLCLKMQFGVPLARLGTPHLIRYHILMPHSPIRQERQTPPHAGSYHPALRERGRAIPSSHIVPKIQDRPDHMVPPMKMRPPMGGAGHVVAAPKGNGFVGLLMPLYTIGIVIFFLYTLTKVLRKSSDNEIIRPEYSTVNAEKEYQKIVFNPEIFAAAVTAVSGTKYDQNTRSPTLGDDEKTPTIEDLKEPAGDIEIDQLRRRLVETEAAMERIVVQMSNLSRSVINCSTPPPEPKDPNGPKEENNTELEQSNEATPTIKVVNMEMTAACEGGQRYSRPTTPTLVPPHNHQEEKEKSPPISIYLEGALPSQCELLVTDSKTQELLEEESMEVPVVLSGKMTLSLISLDQESQDELGIETPQCRTPTHDERSSNNTVEDNAKAKSDSESNKSIDVLEERYLDEENDSESDHEEDEEISEDDAANDDLLVSSDKLPCNSQSKENQQILQQNYVRNESESSESDEEIDDTVSQNSNKREVVSQICETEDDEDEDEEEEETEEEEEEDEENEEEEDEADYEQESDEENDEDEENEHGDVEEVAEKDEKIDEDKAKVNLRYSSESDNDDGYEEERRKTQLKKATW